MDLAEITFRFPFKIPPYFALIIRAIGVLEGIALKGNPQFAIVDEAYPYISKRLLTDETPRLREALRYMVYGRSGVFDAERMIDMLQALEKFVAVRDMGDGSAFKVNGVRGGVDLGSAGDMQGTRALEPVAGVVKSTAVASPAAAAATALPLRLASATDPSRLSADALAAAETRRTREALSFFFSKEGEIFRVFLLNELVGAADALSREAANTLMLRLGLASASVPPFPGVHVLRELPAALVPPLSDEDEQALENIRKLVVFFLGDVSASETLASAGSAESVNQAQALVPLLVENQEDMRRFGLQIVGRLAELQAQRAIGFVREQLKTT